MHLLAWCCAVTCHLAAIASHNNGRQRQRTTARGKSRGVCAYHCTDPRTACRHYRSVTIRLCQLGLEREVDSTGTVRPGRDIDCPNGRSLRLLLMGDDHPVPAVPLRPNSRGSKAIAVVPIGCREGCCAGSNYDGSSVAVKSSRHALPTAGWLAVLSSDSPSNDMRSSARQRAAARRRGHS